VIDEIEALRLFRDEIPGPSTDAWTRARAAIGTARSEEEPARRRPATRPGRRRLLSASLAAGLAAGVAALLAVLLPGSPATGPGGAQGVRTAAYVTRIEHALSPSGQAGLVANVRTILAPGNSVEISARGLDSSRQAGGARTMIQWMYQDTTLASAFTATGRRLFDARLATAPGGGPEVVAVIYQDATWWRAVSGPQATGGSRRPACGPGLQIGPAGWAAGIRSALKCGAFTLDGRQRVDGVGAIKLAATRGPLMLWVSPKTYLPVRIVSSISGGTNQTDFRWLPASPASLAHLTLRVPAGFRQVPPPA
jgi:hypothetical protein